MSQLANLIKDIRGKRTQTQLAEICGMAPQTISKIETTTGKSDPSKISLSTIHRISKALKLSKEKHLEVIQAWMRLQLGNDYHEFDISPRNYTAKEAKSSLTNQIASLLPDLSQEDQKVILEACKSNEIRKAMKAMISFAKHE